METIETARLESPVGPLDLFVRKGALVGIAFDGRTDSTLKTLQKRFGDVSLERRKDPGGMVKILKDYLAGDMRALSRVKVDLGGTPFQRDVWKALRKIRPGRTYSYSDLAEAVGRPTAVRAVAMANAHNPVPIVVPCHRVIGKDGALRGFGGGVEKKQWLLAHERFATVTSSRSLEMSGSTGSKRPVRGARQHPRT